MRLLFAAVSAAAFLLTDVAHVHAQCAGTIRSGGATACQQVVVSPLEIVTAANKLTVTKFDDSASPTAILDGVHIVALTVQYDPLGTFQTSSTANNFFIEATVTFTTLTSSADATVIQDAEWAALPGTFQRESNTDGTGTDGLVQRTFRKRDVTYEASTLNAADGAQTFTPANGVVVPSSWNSFASTSGQLSMDTPADPDYRGVGTWDLTFAFDALASSSFGGAGLTVSLTQVVLVGLTVQYDFHLPTIQGDPQFVGFHGQAFQVHGVPDESFSLISTPSYYVNSKFVYLATGSCFYNDTACFTHAGTYMSEIYVGMPGASIHVVAGAHQDGLRSATLNGHQLSLGHRVALPAAGNSSFMQRRSASSVLVQLEAFSFNIVNSDQFVNIEMNFVDAAVLRAGAKRHVIRETEPDAVSVLLSTHYPSIPLHGLIGQTWRNVEYSGHQYIEGEVSDYQLDSLKSHRFIFSKYHAQAADMEDME